MTQWVCAKPSRIYSVIALIASDFADAGNPVDGVKRPPMATKAAHRRWAMLPYYTPYARSRIEAIAIANLPLFDLGLNHFHVRIDRPNKTDDPIDDHRRRN